MMKERDFSWAKVMVIGLLLLLLAACSNQEPAPTEVPPEAPEGQEEATAVTDPAYPAATEGEATETGGEAPEISQTIYSWGEVADQVWVLVGYGDVLNPTVVEEGIVITASFSSTDGQLSGTGGCNNYFTAYESTDDGGLTISGPIGSTMMACENSMEAEATYFATLETVSGWTLNESGNLELAYDSGQGFEEKLVYIPGSTPLTGPIWQLVSYGSPDELITVTEGTAVTAQFAPETDTNGTVAGNATCNTYSTSYTLDGENISFGLVAGTMMACESGAEQEDAYLAALGSAQTYQLIGPNMQITYDGGVLNFTSLNLPLENVLWQAVMVNGQAVPDGVEITAIFVADETAVAGTLGGNAGCNNYSTGYAASSDTSTNPPTHALTINSPMAMTMMACPGEALAAVEQSYLANLETAESYEILGNKMVLQSTAGEVQYAANRQPLLGTLWTLESLGDVNNPQPPVEGSNFTAIFNSLPTLPTGTVVGETGCNDYNATFAADLTSIKINLPAKTNNEDCPWGAGNFEVEQQFFLGLNAATSYTILGNKLHIPYGEGEAMQALNFVATQPPVTEGALDLTPLDNTSWYLSAIGDVTTLPGSSVTAAFAINDDGVTGEISGSGGCNAYNGPIAENLVIGPLASTKKACQQPVMDQESNYFTWLQSAYGFDRAGDQLLVSTANGILTFNSQPILDQANELQNITWYGISYETLQAIPGSNPTAFFGTDGSSLNGKTGCNDYSGAYKAEQGNKLTISNMSNTRAACASDDLTKQEETFLRLMPAAVTYSVSGTQLQIRTVDGGTMNFTSIPPQAPAGPTAVIVGPDFADIGKPIVFEGTQSTAGAASITDYDWDMGDGGFLSGATVQYSYDTPGNYTIRMRVTDRNGQTNIAKTTIQVNPVVEVTPPTAVIEGPGMAFVGDSVTFSAAGSQQGTAVINSYDWQSGDGNNSGPVADNSFTTIYAQPGTYYPSVAIADAGGLSDSAGMSIVINAKLEGSNWILSNAIPGTSISLNFGNGSLSGFAGCNSYNGGFTTTLAGGNTNSISVGSLTSSQALCSEEIMNQEQSYLADLQTATSYTINGNILTLTTGSGTLTYSAAVATPYAAPAATQ